MAKAFADPVAALNAMLDTLEAQPERKAAILVKPDYARIPDTDALESFVRIVREAESVGAIAIEMKRGLENHQIARLRLADPAALYRYLRREQGRSIAARAVEQLRSALGESSEWIAAVLEDAQDRWARRRGYRGYQIEDADELLKALQLARALAIGPVAARDARSFSTQICGDSKALERNRPAIAGFLMEATGSRASPDEDALARFGIFAYPDPVLIKGPVRLEGANIDLTAFRPYAAVPEGNVDDVRCVGRPEYVLTIENKTSFNRHVREIGDLGVVVFTGGFPSRAAVGLLKAVAANCRGAPWFHWGDVDGGGVRIFRFIEETVVSPAGLVLRPHLMSEALARQHGVASRRRPGLKAIVESDSAITGLARYLASGESVFTLEQEALPPERPVIGDVGSITAAG